MLFIIIMPQMNSGTSYLFNAELPGGTAERTLPKIKESAMMILLIYVILTAVEVALLLLAGLPIFQALNLALATMATGGFSYYHDSLISFRSVYVEIIAIVFMLIASMNFSLYYKIWRGDWASVRQDSEHRYYLLILTTAAALICGNLYFPVIWILTALFVTVFSRLCLSVVRLAMRRTTITTGPASAAAFC